jgi:ketosteroid isomerase-like protein
MCAAEEVFPTLRAVKGDPIITAPTREGIWMGRSTRLCDVGGRAVRMTRFLLAVLAISVSLAGCAPSDTGANAQESRLQQQADIYAIDQIEVNWHKASSTKNVDLMMTLWADNATFEVATKMYTGKAQIRNFFANYAGSFKPEHNWISETPAYKVRVTVNGDEGTLYFECHYVDLNTRQIIAVVSSDALVSRIKGRWLITQAIFGTPPLSP